MKAAAVISMIVAIVLGIGALGSYVDDSSKREKALDRMLKVNFDSPRISSYTDEIDRYDASERTDGVLGLVAITFLIGSLVMFSKAKPA